MVTVAARLSRHASLAGLDNRFATVLRATISLQGKLWLHSAAGANRSLVGRVFDLEGFYPSPFSHGSAYGLPRGLGSRGAEHRRLAP